MTPTQIIDYFGSQSEAGRKLGFTRAAVSVWLRKGEIPPRTQVYIQRMTRGRLKANKQGKNGEK